MSSPKNAKFYSLNELSEIDMVVLEYEQMHNWLRPNNIPISLRDGREFSVSFQELKQINEIVSKLENSHIESTHTIYTESILFLINKETYSVKWCPHEFVPDGYMKENNFWIYRESNEIQAFPTYPEKADVIEQDFLGRMNAPRIDPLTLESPVDDKTIDDVKEVNIHLNNLIEERLENMESLQEARINVENQQREILNILLIGFIDAFAIHSVFGLGTPSILETYLQLKPDEKENSNQPPDKQDEITSTKSETIDKPLEKIAIEQPDQTSLPAGAWQDNADQGLSISEAEIEYNTEQQSYIDGPYYPDAPGNPQHFSESNQASVQNAESENTEKINFSGELPVCEEVGGNDSSPWSDQTMIKHTNEAFIIETPQEHFLPSDTILPEFFEQGPNIDQCHMDAHEEPDVNNNFDPGDLPFDGD